MRKEDINNHLDEMIRWNNSKAEGVWYKTEGNEWTPSISPCFTHDTLYLVDDHMVDIRKKYYDNQNIYFHVGSETIDKDPTHYSETPEDFSTKPIPEVKRSQVLYINYEGIHCVSDSDYTLKEWEMVAEKWENDVRRKQLSIETLGLVCDAFPKKTAEVDPEDESIEVTLDDDDERVGNTSEDWWCE